MENSIQKIAIIGLGNVGSHLYDGFLSQGIEITHVVSRSEPDSAILANSTWITDPKKLPSNQLVMVCVPDDQIAGLLTEIPEDCPVAYTSGSIELNSLGERKMIGVFYPLQTFTKGNPVNLFEVPFFIEARKPEFASRLFDLAWQLSRKVSYASSEERKKMHLAAVFINNFTNHLAHLAKAYLDKNNLEFDHLLPLLKETARKLESQDPFTIQTGPARRNDKAVIEAQLNALDDPTQKEIYRLISKSIHQTYFND